MNTVLQLEEMIDLAKRVRDWDFQIREEHRVSARGDDFKESTRTIYHNTYCGNVPSTGNPGVKIKICQVTGEYFDFGTRFEEDPQIIITAQVDSKNIGYGGINTKSKDGVGVETMNYEQVLLRLFDLAQKNYHSKARGIDERQKVREDHNLKCAYNRAKKILRAKE